jgi:hypothetical protein
VRKQLGIEFSGEFEPNDWMLADVHLEGTVANDEISIFWHGRGLLVLFPITPERFRVIADLGKSPGAEKPVDPTLTEVQAMIDERGPKGVRIHDPIWLSGFRIHERKVGEYSKGRVFLAGDAAHIHSPAGGQGMNTGMQDAFNLAWKLALVQKGRGKASPLLNSYSPERSAVGDLVLRNATVLTQVATLRNPVLQSIRNHLFAWVGSLSLVQQRAIASLTEMDIHYPDSLLNSEEPGDAWSGVVCAGDRLPDATLTSLGTRQPIRLHELIRGTKHSLLLFPELANVEDIATGVAGAIQGFTDLVQAYWILPGELAELQAESFQTMDSNYIAVDSEGQARDRLGLHRSAIALVRPDGYLCFRGHAGALPQLRAHLERFLICGSLN